MEKGGSVCDQACVHCRTVLTGIELVGAVELLDEASHASLCESSTSQNAEGRGKERGHVSMSCLEGKL